MELGLAALLGHMTAEEAVRRREGFGKQLGVRVPLQHLQRRWMPRRVGGGVGERDGKVPLFFELCWNRPWSPLTRLPEGPVWWEAGIQWQRREEREKRKRERQREVWEWYWKRAERREKMGKRRWAESAVRDEVRRRGLHGWAEAHLLLLEEEKEGEVREEEMSVEGVSAGEMDWVLEQVLKGERCGAGGEELETAGEAVSSEWSVWLGRRIAGSRRWSSGGGECEGQEERGAEGAEDCCCCWRCQAL